MSNQTNTSTLQERPAHEVAVADLTSREGYLRAYQQALEQFKSDQSRRSADPLSTALRDSVAALDATIASGVEWRKSLGDQFYSTQEPDKRSALYREVMHQDRILESLRAEQAAIQKALSLRDARSVDQAEMAARDKVLSMCALRDGSQGAKGDITQKHLAQVDDVLGMDRFLTKQSVGAATAAAAAPALRDPNVAVLSAKLALCKATLRQIAAAAPAQQPEELDEDDLGVDVSDLVIDHGIRLGTYEQAVRARSALAALAGNAAMQDHDASDNADADPAPRRESPRG